jgi:hypothetical protein
MKRFVNKKVAAAVLTAGLVMGGGGIAFAWFTSGGAGSGSASVGTAGAADFTITGTAPAGNLYPGNSPLTFTVRAQNLGSGSEHIDAITITVAHDVSGNALDAGGTAILGCTSSWFTVSGPVTVNSTLGPLAYSNPIDATIGMSEAGVTQDACQGKSIKLDYPATAPV